MLQSPPSPRFIIIIIDAQTLAFVLKYYNDPRISHTTTQQIILHFTLSLDSWAYQIETHQNSFFTYPN